MMYSTISRPTTPSQLYDLLLLSLRKLTVIVPLPPAIIYNIDGLTPRPGRLTMMSVLRCPHIPDRAISLGLALAVSPSTVIVALPSERLLLLLRMDLVLAVLVLNEGVVAFHLGFVVVSVGSGRCG